MGTNSLIDPPPAVFQALMLNLSEMSWSGGWITSDEMVGAEFPKPQDRLLDYPNTLLDRSQVSDVEFTRLVSTNMSPDYPPEHAQWLIETLRDALAKKIRTDG